MAAPILATKLHISPLPPKVVLRPQLVGRLMDGLHGQLTLICAPAGFGKTTLVSEWVAECGRQVAWLSLDDSHNDATSFVAYVVVALQTVSPTLGTGALDILKSPQVPGLEPALTVLMNDISTLIDPMILVLDDYHFSCAPPSLIAFAHPNGDTVISGPLVDQAALYGVLKKVRNLGLPLISVNPITPKQTQAGKDKADDETRQP